MNQTRMIDADLCRRQAALFEDDALREADVAIQAALLNMSQGCGCLAKQLDWIGTMRPCSGKANEREKLHELEWLGHSAYKRGK